MNLEDLRAAQVDERGTDSLQPLPATFYEQAADYLADLRSRRDRLADRADDPFGSDAVRQLTDELETAEEVVEALYERRVGKLIKRASLAASGLTVDDEGLTDEERALFADLVERIEANRATVLAAFDDHGELRSEPSEATADRPAHSGGQSGEVSDPDAVDGADPPTGDGPDGESESRTAGGSRPERPPDGDDRPSSSDTRGAPALTDPDEPERVTVRITADVGEIYGVDDRVYTLGREDVVTLPAANARPLLERDAAQRLD